MAQRNWDAWEEHMRHPDGRALGGEPCVVCDGPIQPGVHWKWRDRHVCSSRCNTTLRRRLNRAIDRGQVALPDERIPVVDRPDGPAFFGTFPDEEFPYAHAGLSPRPGDVVERHGSYTAYAHVAAAANAAAPRPVVACVHEATGSTLVISVDEHWNQANCVIWGVLMPGSRDLLQWGAASAFQALGVTWHWYTEVIRSIDEGGEPYTWTACVCSPTPTLEPLWTPAQRERSERLNRIAQSTARHQRRQRIVSTSAERIDPHEVFEADGWTCMLCGGTIDRSLSHPSPDSPSLDHIVPLAAGGAHVRSNVQAAHLRCNIVKGARTLSVTPTLFDS